MEPTTQTLPAATSAGVPVTITSGPLPTSTVIATVGPIMVTLIAGDGAARGYWIERRYSEGRRYGDACLIRLRDVTPEEEAGALALTLHGIYVARNAERAS